MQQLKQDRATLKTQAVPGQADKHREMPATGVLPFPVPAVPPDAPELYRQFWQLWREEQFFACHEVLEALWRSVPGAERWFYNGLLHCAVAIYQHRRGNGVGAARQLARAQAKLAPFRPLYYGVDVDSLLAGVERALTDSLAQLSPHQRAQLDGVRQAAQRRMKQDSAGCTKLDRTEFNHE